MQLERKDAMGPARMFMWTAWRPSFETQRAVMVDFIEDKLTITAWFRDPENHDEGARIASKATRAPSERFGPPSARYDTCRAPYMMPNLEALQRNIDTVRDPGFVRNRIDTCQIADPSVINVALAGYKMSK